MSLESISKNSIIIDKELENISGGSTACSGAGAGQGVGQNSGSTACSGMNSGVGQGANSGMTSGSTVLAGSNWFLRFFRKNKSKSVKDKDDVVERTLK